MTEFRKTPAMRRWEGLEQARLIDYSTRPAWARPLGASGHNEQDIKVDTTSAHIPVGEATTGSIDLSPLSVAPVRVLRSSKLADPSHSSDGLRADPRKIHGLSIRSPRGALSPYHVRYTPTVTACLKR